MENDVANCASFRCNARQYSYDSYNRRWNTGGQPLDAAILRAHLNNQGNNALKELARLILAQNRPGYNNIYLNHNVGRNSNIDYIISPQLQLQQLLEQRQQLQLLQQLLPLQPQPQPQPLNQMMLDLTNTSTVRYTRQHMFNHGHMGYYPFCIPYYNDWRADVLIRSPRGVFNIDNVIPQRIINARLRSVGYNIDPANQLRGVISLLDTANNIIEKFFSENITFLSCGEIRSVVHGTE